MSLELLQRRRYARQILLAEIGIDGQERLCAQTIGEFQGDSRAANVAERYLKRAGLVEGEGPTVSLPTSNDIATIAGTPNLEVAAAYLVGALSAVETIKSSLDHPPAVTTTTSLRLSPEESSG